MPVDYTQTRVDLAPHELVVEATGNGTSNIELHLSNPETVERATASANTVQMLQAIQALATSALNALK